MFGSPIAIVMSMVIAAGGAIQAPPTSYFVGTWTNISERPGGPASFTVAYRDGKTFVKIDPQPETEATVYRLISTGSGPRKAQDADALIVDTNLYLFVIKRSDAGKALLEMFAKKSREPGRMLYYSSEPYAKGK